jgi:hypothetical protein
MTPNPLTPLAVQVKAQFDQWVIDLDNESRALLASHQHEVLELRRQLDEADKRADEAKLEEELRYVKTELAALRVECDSCRYTILVVVVVVTRRCSCRYNILLVVAIDTRSSRR